MMMANFSLTDTIGVGFSLYQGGLGGWVKAFLTAPAPGPQNGEMEQIVKWIEEYSLTDPAPGPHFAARSPQAHQVLEYRPQFSLKIVDFR